MREAAVGASGGAGNIWPVYEKGREGLQVLHVRKAVVEQLLQRGWVWMLAS